MPSRSSILLVGAPEEVFSKHRAPGPHPERPERLDAALRGLRRAAPNVIAQTAPEASDEELRRCHASEYLDELRNRLSAGSGFLDPDTFFNEASREAAWRASGGAAMLARAMVNREADATIGLFRPPGHHARPNQAMGFCILNHIAVAARAAQDAGAARVAIVDWDVHHGNGTQEIFYGDPSVLFVSLHQYPQYPGSGRPQEIGDGDGIGATINFAMPSGAGDAAYREAFRRVVLPELGRFEPDIVLVSAGFDAHRDDPLGGLALESETYGAMTAALMTLERPLGFILEGGYDLDAIESSMLSVAQALRGDGLTFSDGQLSAFEERAIRATEEELGGRVP